METDSSEDWSLAVFGAKEGIQLAGKVSGSDNPDVSPSLFNISCDGRLFAAADDNGVVLGEMQVLRQALKDKKKTISETSRIEISGTTHVAFLANSKQLVVATGNQIGVYDVDSKEKITGVELDSEIETLKPLFKAQGFVLQLANRKVLKAESSGAIITASESSEETTFAINSDDSIILSSKLAGKGEIVKFLAPLPELNTYYVVYGNPEEETEYTSKVVTLEDGSRTRVEVEDACMPYGDTSQAFSWYFGSFTSRSDPKNKFTAVAACSQSTDLLLITDNAKIVPIDDSTTLPFTTDDEDICARGACLDLWDDGEVISPMKGISNASHLPTWLLLTQEGRILAWHIVSRVAIQAGAKPNRPTVGTGANLTCLEVQGPPEEAGKQSDQEDPNDVKSSHTEKSDDEPVIINKADVDGFDIKPQVRNAHGTYDTDNSNSTSQDTAMQGEGNKQSDSDLVNKPNEISNSDGKKDSTQSAELKGPEKKISSPFGGLTSSKWTLPSEKNGDKDEKPTIKTEQSKSLFGNANTTETQENNLFQTKNIFNSMPRNNTTDLNNKPSDNATFQGFGKTAGNASPFGSVFGKTEETKSLPNSSSEKPGFQNTIKKDGFASFSSSAPFSAFKGNSFLGEKNWASADSLRSNKEVTTEPLETEKKGEIKDEKKAGDDSEWENMDGDDDEAAGSNESSDESSQEEEAGYTSDSFPYEENKSRQLSDLDANKDRNSSNPLTSGEEASVEKKSDSPVNSPVSAADEPEDNASSLKGNYTGDSAGESNTDHSNTLDPGTGKPAKKLDDALVLEKSLELLNLISSGDSNEEYNTTLKELRGQYESQLASRVEEELKKIAEDKSRQETELRLQQEARERAAAEREAKDLAASKAQAAREEEERIEKITAEINSTSWPSDRHASSIQDYVQFIGDSSLDVPENAFDKLYALTNRHFAALDGLLSSETDMYSSTGEVTLDSKHPVSVRVGDAAALQDLLSDLSTTSSATRDASAEDFVSLMNLAESIRKSHDGITSLETTMSELNRGVSDAAYELRPIPIESLTFMESWTKKYKHVRDQIRTAEYELISEHISRSKASGITFWSLRTAIQNITHRLNEQEKLFERLTVMEQSLSLQEPTSVNKKLAQFSLDDVLVSSVDSAQSLIESLQDRDIESITTIV